MTANRRTDERAMPFDSVAIKAAIASASVQEAVTFARISHEAEDIEKQEDEKAHGESLDTLNEIAYVDFDEGDPRDPANFTYARKWAITVTASFFSLITDLYSILWWRGTIGISTYTLGFALVPLVTTSFSEEFGRQPLYIISAIGCLLMHVIVALAQSIQMVIIARFLAGAFASTSAAMVGGSIADIWLPYQRGLPMSVFAMMVLAGPGIGCLSAGWIEQNPHLEWRWIQWIHVILLGVLTVAMLICMRETRTVVLLTRLAKKIRKETGNKQYRARVEVDRASLRTLIYISFTRPIYLLFTEPVVASFSLWVGFAWGILYALIESVGPAFSTIHHFSAGQTGTVFVAVIAGCFAGESIQLYQEKLYTKYHSKKGPEARLFSACLAALLFPAGMFIYAWTASPSAPWIGMVMGIFVIMTALFILYVAVFTYLADCYGIFASSALAGQSLSRNLMGTAFPLFTQQMYDRLSYHWGTSLFGFVAVVMIPIPFVLLWKGPSIRAHSKFASQIIHKQ